MSLFEGFFIRRIKEAVDLAPVTVVTHIVPNYTYFPESQRRKEVSACMTTNGDLYILGATYKGEIILDQMALGHELLHWLAIQDGRLRNPDKR